MIDLTTSRRGKYIKAKNKGKDALIEAIFTCAEDDRFLISENLIERACKKARCSERSYRNYFSIVADNNGTVYSGENKLITHVLADMVIREEKFYLGLIAKYEQEPCHNDAAYYKYVKKVTEHISEHRTKYLYEIRNDKLTLFRLFTDTVFVLYGRTPKVDFPQFMTSIITDNLSRKLANLYFFWAAKGFTEAKLPYVQARIAEIFEK